MKERKTNFIFIILILTSFTINAQERRGDLQVMFYNAENLFDIKNDTLKKDDEFTPEGERHWTEYRYQHKINNIFKVIANAGVWSPPEIIGLCEIENKQVLSDLIYKTPLYKYDYNIIHFESPDIRGIDIGCIYAKKELELINSYPLRVTDVNDTSFKTRDILYACFRTKKQDTIHLYLNHWPSRSGGQERSDDKRMLASNTLLRHIQNNFSNKPANIIIMGDFNDEPGDNSINHLLSAKSPALINLTSVKDLNEGTLKYQGTWNIFDQIIVSSPLINKANKLSTTFHDFHIIRFTYLLTDDTSFSGLKPFRTYNGYDYTGGFSDHLPVIVDIWY